MLLIGVCLFAFQTAFAVFTGSLSLLSDTAHVGGDSFALLLVVLAEFTAHRIDKLNGESLGNTYHNVELLATAFNGLILIVAGIALSIEASSRFSDPPTVSSIILIPGVAGLLVNLYMFRMLHDESGHLSVQSATAHVVFDSLASFGVIVAGFLILASGEKLIDPIISFFIIFLIVMWGIRLVAKSLLTFSLQNHKKAL